MINFIAPITELTSYGLVGKYILKGLYKKNALPSLYPLGDYDDEPFIKEAIKLAETKRNLPSVKLFHQNQLEGIPEDSARIGFPIFELDRFNAQEREQLKYVDALFVCSHWAKDVVSQYINDDLVHIVPLGVDNDIFSRCWNIPTTGTTFLNIGKWEYRKGHDFLVNAFRKAFSPSDDVKLIMHCDNIFIGNENKKWEELYRNKLGYQVVFTNRRNYQRHEDLAELYAYSNCLVAPTRAEGWGMPILEAMAAGKHVITTKVSGQSEYVSGKNSLLIETDGDEIANDGVWFYPGRTENGLWAKLGDSAEESLISHLRRIHALNQCSQLGFNTDGIDTARKFSWDNTVKAFCGGVNKYA